MSILNAPPHLIVLDACVLMSGLLRPTLLALASAGLFTPLWSERIGEEWRRNAARLWSIPPEALQDEWDRMQVQFPQANVKGFEAYEAGLRYSDPKDWHVIAAALAARARSGLPVRPQASVLTWNLKDFNRSELRRQDLQVFDPDRLLAQWWRDHAVLIRAALQHTLDDLARQGRGREGNPTDIVRRERLFRLSRLIQHHATSNHSIESTQPSLIA